MAIYRWAGRVYLSPQFLADIVGETRPYNSAKNLHSHCLLGGAGLFKPSILGWYCW
jgi:hypothetical protein